MCDYKSTAISEKTAIIRCCDYERLQVYCDYNSNQLLKTPPLFPCFNLHSFTVKTLGKYFLWHKTANYNINGFSQEKRKAQNKHCKVLYTTVKLNSATFFHKSLFVKVESC